jgi:hypothetical protein
MKEDSLYFNYLLVPLCVIALSIVFSVKFYHWAHTTCLDKILQKEELFCGEGRCCAMLEYQKGYRKNMVKSCSKSALIRLQLNRIGV